MTVAETLQTPVRKAYDVIVAGGGPAGACAAIAAGRSGARTLLIEAGGALGGVWTRGLLAFVFDVQAGGICQELRDALKDEGAAVDVAFNQMACFTYDPETLKRILEQRCTDASVDLLLHARAVGVLRAGRRVTGVITESASGREAWPCAVAIDATGDGHLAAAAGCGFEVGSEADGATQPMTLMAALVVPDLAAAAPFVSFWGGAPNHTGKWQAFKQLLTTLGVDPSYGHPTLFQMHGNILALMVNHAYGVRSDDALQVTAATVRARAEVHAVAAALAQPASPLAGCRLAMTADHIGVRDGRRIRGRYRVTADDLQRGARHADGICRVSFNVDVHSTDPAKGKMLATTPVTPYDIPLRALIAADVDNLLIAGRCLSGEWLAHASYRVTGPAAATGEAAGRLAAQAAQAGQSPHAQAQLDAAQGTPPRQ